MIKLNTKRVSKVMLHSILLSLVIGCNISNTNTTRLQGNIVKIQSKTEAKILNFESKVKKKGLDKVTQTPTGKEIKLNLDILSSGSDKIKIPESGEFNLIIESSNLFNITDNDATDGEAKIQLPPQVLETFINTSYQENNNNSKLDFEDKLYYLKDSLSNGNYRIGKRLFPIPDTWHSDDGNRYILRFNNHGIKRADLKFCQSDKVEYPAGTAEIGPSGGTIELPGVSKLEIPAGAINQNTVVVIKQELQGAEPLTPLPLFNSGKKQAYADYVSPLIRIEPMGLKLNKDATLYFDEVDLKRLGNNHPRAIYFQFSRDQNIWYALPRKTEIPIEKWTPYLPAKFNEFGYYAKFIDKGITPTSHLEADNQYIDNENNFSVENNTNFKTLSGSDIKFDIQNVSDPKQKAALNKRALNAYNIYSKLGYKLTKCENDDKGYIISVLPPSQLNVSSAISETRPSLETDGRTLCSQIHISSTYFPNKTALEHELWHGFQYSNLSLDILNKPLAGWIAEGSADYMGSKTYNQYTASTNNDKEEYLSDFDDGINKINDTIINRVDKSTSHKGYSAIGFFNTIARLEKKDNSMMLAFNDISGNSNNIINPSSKYLDYYHDYAVDSFIATLKNYEKHLGKLFVYNPTQSVNISGNISIDDSKVIKAQFIGNNLKSGNPEKISGTLDNFSAKYFKVNANITKAELHFDVNSISNGIKITPILFSKDKNEFMYVPIKRKNNREQYETYTSSFQLLDGSNNKLTFGDKTGYVVLAMSYSDKSKNLTSQGSYDISIGYGCPKSIDEKDSNKNVGVMDNSICFKNKN